MSEWIRFWPGEEHVGLRARFRKVIGDKVEEVVGMLKPDPHSHPWHISGVMLVADEDGRILPFPNGESAFYDDKDGRRQYLNEPFDVEYYYQELD